MALNDIISKFHPKIDYISNAWSFNSIPKSQRKMLHSFISFFLWKPTCSFLVWRNVSVPQWLLIFLISCNLVKMEHLRSIKALGNRIKTYDSYRVWWVSVVFLPRYSRVITHNSEKYSIKGEKIQNVPKNKIESPQESFQNNNKKYC